ncbi:PTS glucose transporter subunit IIA [Alicyclobacillus fastidiosus]|uniref:PTS glucose transporter subunit IIA n=1 Tax=Alicyclobacillus fastidiosus TaxID=392011 RepID=A0ABY6ZE32_9BACL|nr:PTS glucose transporter subunit IIA [Alicyclobacillus fastidiosus]WAH41145.1 PTS glucose transporter subunit IIA [Alicyclobacillus fastidiosus]GMA62707.1 PTS glucose transporter subunit IIA [Alicyclobacillus fastidiosus]
MFKNLFKRASDASDEAKVVTIYAPVDGDIVPIDAVEDPVFAQRMVGDGLAIRPTSDTIVAPVAGTLTQLFPTGHAAGITTPEGLEVLIHIGIDTVELKGEGFTKLLEQGSQVEVGTPIVKLDLARLKDTAKSLVTPVIVTNMQKVECLTTASEARVQASNSWVLKVVLKTSR